MVCMSVSDGNMGRDLNFSSPAELRVVFHSTPGS